MEIWPTVESPKPFILFSGLSALGASVGRRVWFDHDPHVLFPMLNLLLIGNSGCGKSTALGLGFRLLRDLPPNMGPQIINGASTKQKLHADLRPRPQAVLFASELANFFSKEKFMEGLIPYVTELLDYGPYVELRTQKDDVVRVMEPAVTVEGGSTVEWLQEELPSSAAAGGFLARFLIVNEEHKGQRVALPGQAMSLGAKQRLEAQREKVFGEFRVLALNAEGEMRFRGYEGADVYSTWYSTHQPLSGHLAPFSARAGEFILRLAMLLALSCGRMLLEGRDVELAIALYEYSAAKLQGVVIPFTPKGKLLNMVLRAVDTREMSPTELRRAMRNFCSSSEADLLVASLVASADLQILPNGKLRRLSNGGAGSSPAESRGEFHHEHAAECDLEGGYGEAGS